MLKSLRRPSIDEEPELSTAGEDPWEIEEIAPHTAVHRPVPTFFSESAFRNQPARIVAGRGRGMIEEEDPSPHLAHRAAPVWHRAATASRHSMTDEPNYDQPGQERRRASQRSPSAPSAQPKASLMFLLAGVAALAIGGGLGYATMQYGGGMQTVGAPVAPVIASLTQDAAPLLAAAPAGGNTVINRKPINTATLLVADVTGGLNRMIPLALSADPGVAGEDLILKLSGLPKSAYLTAGSRIADGNWQLNAREAKSVKLVVPQTDTPSFNVAVAALESRTGELEAPTKEMTVAITDAQIVPASAPPENVILKPPDRPGDKATAVPTPVQQQAPEQVALAVPPTEAQGLVAKGDILLKSGDMEMARQFYERAFAQGAKGAAAMGAAKTYDPVIYASLKVQGLKPDPAQAMAWYQRASEAGAPEATKAIAAMKQAIPQ